MNDHRPAAPCAAPPGEHQVGQGAYFFFLGMGLAES